MSKRTWTDEQLIKAAQESECLADVLRKLGLTYFPGNYKTLYNHLDRLDIDRSHWVRHRLPKNPFNKMDLSIALTKNSPYLNNNNLKKRLIKEGLLKEKCAECGLINSWNNKTLVMRLDHINGDSRDNRLENLRLLCPNCDSQTETFGGRNQNQRIRSNPIKECKICGTRVGNTSKTKLCRSCAHPRKTKPERICQNINCNTLLTRKQKRFCSEVCANTSRRKHNRPTKEILAQEIQIYSWLELGRKYSVSDNAIRKWARSYDLIK